MVAQIQKNTVYGLIFTVYLQYLFAHNLVTGRLLFQFYIVFDFWFETINENSEKSLEK